MQDTRIVFEEAQRLVARFEHLKSDIRGTARHEQQAISQRLDALPYPATIQGNDWSIYQHASMYRAQNGNAFCEYWSPEMEDHAQDMANRETHFRPASDQPPFDDDLPI